MDDFFEHLGLPSVREIDKHLLDAPLTQSDVETAIMKMASRKTSGADGCGSEFYNYFKKQIYPILLSLYVEIVECETMPPSM